MEGAVYVGQAVRWVGLPQSEWANPFKIDKHDRKRDGMREDVIAKYRTWLLQHSPI